MSLDANTNDSSPLIPLADNDGVQAVMGRELHNFLEIQSNYTTWIGRLIEKYGFIAGQDFIPKMEESSGGRPSENHVLTLDMAKEVSMVQNNEKGRQARRYFIECERRVKSAPVLSDDELMARAVLAANSKIQSLELENLEQAAQLEAAAPKVAYHDEFVAESDLIQFRTLANQLLVGEQRLREMLRAHGWIYRLDFERWSNKKNAKVTEYQWRAKATYKHYFQLVPAHDAPRLGGEVRQSLKLTPAGAVAVARAVRRWQSEEQEELPKAS